VIENVEYHNGTCEGVLPLDADIVIFAGLGMPQMPGIEIEAFVVPAGTMVKYRPGVLHGTQFVVDKELANIVVLLPERTFATDMHGHRFEESDQIKIKIERG
jgi:ureidoglycolate lyase